MWWLTVHAFCGTEGSSHRLYQCDVIACSTTEFCVVCSCSDCSSDTDAASPNLVRESERCRIAWVVVLPVLADQDAFGSNSYQSNSLLALCERSSGL